MDLKRPPLMLQQIEIPTCMHKEIARTTPKRKKDKVNFVSQTERTFSFTNNHMTFLFPLYASLQILSLIEQGYNLFCIQVKRPPKTKTLQIKIQFIRLKTKK